MSCRESLSTAILAAARYEANAIRALEAGLGHAPAAEPPALYSFDPDTGRLAVTTPTYNTAIIAVNQRAFPYGGLDLARLYDGGQDVAANIGGTGTATFGLTARSGGQVLRTQYGSHAYTPGGAPLRLLRAPQGVGASASRSVAAYAGPFTDLRVQARARADGGDSSYRFTPAGSTPLDAARRDRAGDVTSRAGAARPASKRRWPTGGRSRSGTRRSPACAHYTCSARAAATG